MKNAIHPTSDQIDDFIKASGEGPIFMVNLLTFKDRATYKDGEDVSGETAYRRYAKGFADYVRPHGVVPTFGGKSLATLIGDGSDTWDAVAIVKYPSAKLMIELTSSDAYRKIHRHRRAGLEGQLLIACDDTNIF